MITRDGWQPAWRLEEGMALLVWTAPGWEEPAKLTSAKVVWNNETGNPIGVQGIDADGDPLLIPWHAVVLIAHAGSAS